jgi:hypothetical protein
MATFAEQMVAKYEALLLANAGATSVAVDGVQVSYADLEAKYQHWSRAAARAAGTTPGVSTVAL